VLAFWCVGLFTKIYQFALTGAILEIAWPFMVLLIFFLPIFSFVLWVKDRFNVRSLNLYSLILMLVVVAFFIRAMLNIEC
jgi:hypothetical protein